MMLIPAQRIPISLEKTEPSQMTVESLKKQLDAIGLTCEDANSDRLADYIKDVRGKLPNGRIQSLTIAKPDETKNPGANGYLRETSIGNWKPDGDFGYQTQLSYIVYETHFDWLKENRSGFTGVKEVSPPAHGQAPTVQAIKDQFIQISYTASSTLINGLDKSTMESVLSNAIAPLTDKTAHNYDVHDSRVIYLVDNYDPTTKEADGIGVVQLKWHLVVQDYREKSKDSIKHNWSLDVSAWAVLYSSLGAMYGDYNAALAHFKDGGNFQRNPIPPEPTELKIFDRLPPANHETFIHSLPLVSKSDYVDVIVLYAPYLQNIGSIDNTDSDATSTWQKSVTSGFTFSTTQTLSVSAKFQAEFVFANVEFTITAGISFTEQWSKTSTETITFTVPAKAKAFTYQGYLMSSVLRYDPKTNKYTYTETAKFLTSIIATTSYPVLNPIERM